MKGRHGTKGCFIIKCLDCILINVVMIDDNGMRFYIKMNI